MRKIKVKIKVALRLIDDLVKGVYFKFPGMKENRNDFKYSLAIKQEIMPSETFDNKVYNLRLAAEEIRSYVILPGQVFSFWNIIGDPETRFKKGRSIIKGQIIEESGGGLCQVSGIIYYAGLLSGMEIIERHNHSIDIYTDETRFTPLGTDATVVYGCKDLRLKNNFSFPVRLNIVVMDNSISLQLQSPEMIQEKELSSEIERVNGYTNVLIYDEYRMILNRSKYRNLL